MTQAHSLYRFLSTIYNKPHLITQGEFDSILTYLETRSVHGRMEDGFDDESSVEDKEQFFIQGTTGFMRVSGTLTYKPVYTLCGKVGMSYQELLSGVETMIDRGVKTIVFEIDSPGGQAAHVFETTNEIRSLADEKGVKLIGYSDLQMTSAAYAFGCACDVLIANANATVGSIGCVIALSDYSEAMKQAGVRRIYIASGKNKVPFDADGKFKQEFLDSLQADVNELNQQFAEHVSNYTGLSVDSIMALEAESFNANKALELGLINAVMTNKQFASFVANIQEGI